VSKQYVRARLPNGSLAPEPYVFGPGGVWRGERVDSTIDKLAFLDVAHMIAGPLESQNFVPSRDPGTTKLLIMVYWGTTHGTEFVRESDAYVNLEQAQTLLTNIRNQTEPAVMQHRGAESSTNVLSHNFAEASANEAFTSAMAAVEAQENARYQDDFLNVRMLGYDSWWEATEQYAGTPFDYRRQALLDELEEDRYFVVLLAYDFQVLWKEKKHRLLWETRFSIRERRHAFDEDLPAMARFASQYFGQDSHGLIHKAIPLGHVDIGKVRSLGEVPEKPGEASTPAPDNP
jgi:hypothetical protein